MIVRLKITFRQEEYSALTCLALENLRSIPEQAHFIIRQELVRVGFLSKENQIPKEDLPIDTNHNMNNYTVDDTTTGDFIYPASGGSATQT